MAHTNLGLAYSAIDELEKASINHRQALRYEHKDTKLRPLIQREAPITQH